MRKSFLVVLLVAVLTMSPLSGWSFEAQATGTRTVIGKGGYPVPQINKAPSIISNKAKYKSDEVIVKFAPGIDAKQPAGKKKIDALAKTRRLEKKTVFADGTAALFKINDGASVKNKVAELTADSSVAFVQPNYQYHSLSIATNDTYKTDLWHLDNTGQTVNGTAGTADADIDAPEAWSVNEGTNDTIVVAVIDTGVAYNHPDLTANMWDGTACVDENGAVLGSCLHGYDFENEDKDPLVDYETHGTHVAGIIAAVKNNNKGIIGVAPNAKIMALKTSLTTEELVRAISFAEQNGAKVINASWGGYGDDPTLDDAIFGFSGLFIAAAGNDSNDNDGTDSVYPCSLDGQGYSNVICVAATDQNDSLASFSNYGATAVSVGAPGVSIYSSVAYTTTTKQTFEGVTPPAIPAGWVKTGDFGTATISANKLLIGDTHSSPYLDNALSAVTSPNIDVSGSRDGKVYAGFDTTCDTEYSLGGWTDYMELESSSDGGVNWRAPSNLRWDEAALDDDAIEGNNTSGKTSVSITDLALLDLPASSTVKLRFKWTTNGNADASHVGCTVDNVRLKYIGDGSGEQYEFFDGTSMATPVVAGIAALAWGYHPGLEPSVIRNAIVEHGDTLLALDGIVSSGMRVNAKKTLDYLTSAKNIVSFDFDAGSSTVIDDGAQTVAVTVPYGTNLTALTPDIFHEGNTISPNTLVRQNFSSPVVYTVTALDSSTKTYTVRVSVASKLEITAFSFSGISSKASIGDSTIAVTVPYGTNVTVLRPLVTSTASSISPNDPSQNFTAPVIWTLGDDNGFEKTYTVTVTVEGNPFTTTDVSFGKDVNLGKTSDDKVKINFDDVGNAAYYMVSKHDDFNDATWQAITDGARLSLKKKDGKQHFYFRFKSAVGSISKTFEKTITYDAPQRVIKNSIKSVKRGETLTQSGKSFSKNADVEIFFQRLNGNEGHVVVKTDAKGRFRVSFAVNRPAGSYYWYVVDKKTGKKTKHLTYKVV